MNAPLTISVVIPAYNAALTLNECLAALAAGRLKPGEIIVMDDASTDSTREIAQQAQVRVITLDTNHGAARAKNRGAAAATGDILFFTDSDILVKPDSLACLVECFADPGLAGVVGVLDAEIPFQDFASQFKNLWMNFTYARLDRRKNVGLFYTSAAAIRRQVFLALGGFDENYQGASIVEDSEFGQRLWQKDERVIVEPGLVVTHLKAYTLGDVLRTDFLRARALMLLRLRNWGQAFYTSVPFFYQLSVPLLFFLILALLFALFSPLAVWLAIALALLFYLANLPLLKYLADRRGFGFALRAAFFLPFDVFVVGLGMIRGLVDFARGIRY